MKILSVDDCQESLQKLGIAWVGEDSGRGRNLEIPRLGMGTYVELLPGETRRYTLAHFLSHWFPGPTAFVLISAFDNFNPGAYEIFLEHRRLFGNSDHGVFDAPGHSYDLKSPLDVWHLAETISYCQVFNWEGYVISADAETILWMADEVYEIWTLDDELDERLLDALDELDFEPYERVRPRPWTPKPRDD